MPTFRFHRGSLKESLETCFVVNSKHDLFNKIRKFNRLTNKPTEPDDQVSLESWIHKVDDLIINPYCFDDRIGWNTHIVLVKSQCVTQDPYIIGFLSDDLE